MPERTSSPKIEAVSDSGQRNSLAEKVLASLLFAGCALFAGHLLYSAISAFSAQNFLMSDYGVYTNTVYNLANGNGFKFLLDESYLKTHLSFSLVLLIPLFWLIKSPLLLIFVQWAFLTGGCAMLHEIMRKSGTSLVLRAAILFFVCAFPMTQSVMLSEFHGVAAYYLLLPWLVHEILHRKKMVPLPLACILGLREDAGIIILPILLYFAVVHRWNTGYVLAAVCAAYVAVAATILYPMLTGENLFSVRAMEASAQALSSAWDEDAISLRRSALLWLALPVVPVALIGRRRAAPVILFCAAALLMAMLSGMKRQHSLTFHYPAPVVASLACGTAIAVQGGAAGRKARIAASVSLAAVVLGAHYCDGFFLGARTCLDTYKHINPLMKPLMKLSREAPTNGLLLAHHKIAPYFAMRRDIMTFHYYNPEKHTPDLIICDIHELQSGGKLNWLRENISNGSYGIEAHQLPYLMIKRGAAGDAGLLDPPQLVPALMSSHRGRNVYSEEHGLLRYWRGAAHQAPVAIAHGGYLPLEPGAYEAVFTVKSGASGQPPEKGFGTVSVHAAHQADDIASQDIVPPQSGVFFEVKLPFVLEKKLNIEPRVTGGGAELWLQSIVIRSPGKSPEQPPAATRHPSESGS